MRGPWVLLACLGSQLTLAMLDQRESPLLTSPLLSDAPARYFPDEFREEFPDGVAIVALDRRADFHARPDAFAGAGNVLGREAKGLAHVGDAHFTRLTPRPSSAGSTGSAGGYRPSSSSSSSSSGRGLERGLTAAELLARLPDGKATVSKSGEVVDLKSDLRRRLASARKEEAAGGCGSGDGSSDGSGDSSGDGVVSAEAVIAAATAHPSGANGGGDGDGVDGSRAVASLRVRLPEVGARPLGLKLPAQCSVRQLQACVAALYGAAPDDFELRTAAPNRAYPAAGPAGEETLLAAGLAPSAALILRRLI